MQTVLDIIVGTADARLMGYPGGKSKTFHHVINHIPPHKVYIEPFLGSAAVMKAKRPATRDIGIELDPRVHRQLKLELPRAEILLGDGIDYLGRFNFDGTEVVYCDPPYVPTTRRQKRVYRFDLSEAAHERFLTTVLAANARVLISGYDNDLYRDALEGWNTHAYQAKTHTGLRTELLWYNFKRPAELHDYRYLGANYRERQNTRRRLQRLKSRLLAITAQERAMITGWLSDTNNDDSA